MCACLCTHTHMWACVPHTFVCTCLDSSVHDCTCVVCVHLYICLYTHTFVCISTCLCVHTCTCVGIHICRTHVCVCVCIWEHMCMYLCACTYMSVCTYSAFVFVYMYVSICTHACICVHVHMRVVAHVVHLCMCACVWVGVYMHVTVCVHISEQRKGCLTWEAHPYSYLAGEPPQSTFPNEASPWHCPQGLSTGTVPARCRPSLPRAGAWSSRPAFWAGSCSHALASPLCCPRSLGPGASGTPLLEPGPPWVTVAETLAGSGHLTIPAGLWAPWWQRRHHASCPAPLPTSSIGKTLWKQRLTRLAADSGKAGCRAFL